jgi:hypothetical protein
VTNDTNQRVRRKPITSEANERTAASVLIEILTVSRVYHVFDPARLRHAVGITELCMVSRKGEVLPRVKQAVSERGYKVIVVNRLPVISGVTDKQIQTETSVNPKGLTEVSVGNVGKV